MTRWSPLRLHDGGPCPVGDDEEVRVILRRWCALDLLRVAKDWEWGWNLPSQSEGHEIIAYQVALPEARDMQVPWHVLPDGYRWAARDEDGRAYAYQGMPEEDEDGAKDWWPSGSDTLEFIRIDQLVGYDPGDKPWDQSRIERPEGL